MQRIVFACVVAAAMMPAPSGTAADPPRILTPAGIDPAILETLDLNREFTSVAVALDGRAAVARIADPSGESRSVIELSGPTPGVTSVVELPGQLRSLVFSPDSRYLFALQRRRTRRQEHANVVRIDLVDARLRRISARVPSSAGGVALWPHRRSLIIACRNEIRTLLLPDLRSGPLYRVVGDNLSIASVGGSRVLVGRDDGILLLDLADRPGAEEMPRRGRTELAAPVVDIVYSPTTRRGLAQLADGRVVEIGADMGPPRDLGTARILHGTLERATESGPTPEPLAPRATPAQPAPTPTPDPPPTGPQPSPSRSRHLPQSSSVPTVDHSPIQIRGTIAGPGAGRVVAVVLHGPDSVLREAARIPPAADGSWSVDGLSPGRYRIQLDAGGGTVLRTNPALRLVEVTADGSVAAADFLVRGAF